MSIISNRHQFVAYVSTGKEKTVPMSGQRLSVIRFKADKNGKKPMDTQAVSVPVLTEFEPTDCLNSHIVGWLQSVQDDIIRDYCVRGESCVTTENISQAAIEAYLTAQAAGERLTGEVIRDWFVSELQDLMLVAFADKLGYSDQLTEEQTKKLEQMVAVYRDKFVSMAGGRTLFDVSTRTKLAKALELGEFVDGIGARLSAKLKAMEETKVEDMLEL